MQTILESQGNDKKPIKRYVMIGASLVILLPWLANSVFFSSPNNAVISAEGLAIAIVKSGNLIEK